MMSMTLIKMELGRQLRRRRIFFFLALASTPVVLAIVWLVYRGESQASELLGRLEVSLYLNLLIPFLALFFASGLISEEARSQTLTYLLVRPISRLSVLLSKFAAYLVLALVLVVGSLVVTGAVMWLGGGGTLAPFDPDAPDKYALVRASFVVTAAGIFAHGAFFTALGVLVRKPAIPGVVILVVWEGLVSSSIGILRNFTMSFYLRSLFGHMTDIVLPDVVHLEECSALRAVLTMVIFGVGCLAAAWWKLSRTEFRLND